MSNIARQLICCLCDEFTFRVLPHFKLGGVSADILVNMWWGAALRGKASHKSKAIVTCIYDGLSWNVNEESLHQFKLTLKNTDILAVCNEGFVERIEQLVPKDIIPPIALIEDGVDTQLFGQMPLPQHFTACWTGNSTRVTPGGPPDQKGLCLVREACRLAGVKLRILDAAGGGAWPHQKMPEFYQDASCVVIGSYREGTPNPLLEAMSCGRLAVAVREADTGLGVGLSEKLVTPQNGAIVDRNPEAVAAALKRLAGLPQAELIRMSQHARTAALRYDWKIKAEPWRQALRASIYAARDRAAVRSALAGVAHRGMQGAPAAVCEIPAVAHDLISHAPSADDGAPAMQSTPAPGAKDRAAVTVSTAPRYRFDPTRKPRVLNVIDVRGWAFDQNLSDMASYLADQFDFGTWCVTEFLTQGAAPDFDEYDVLFTPYHRWPIEHLIPWGRTVGSLRCQWVFPENPQPPGEKEFACMNRFRAFHVVTRRNYDELKPNCPGAVYLTNPVDTRRFSPAPEHPRLIASWNGNARHASGKEDVKGFHSIIQPACHRAGVPLVYAEYHTKRLAPAQMPGFYQQANVALCASTYEGASNSVMEAMASGLAVIATDVGNHREMRDAQLEHYGETGIILTPRGIDSFAEALKVLREDPTRVRRMGKINRKEIEDRWSWSVWKDPYASFLRMGLP